MTRDPGSLRAEVLAMRERMRESHPPRDDDIKHAHGGIVDVEFIVQYLVLGHAWRFPELTGNLGNIALLGLAANAGLIDHELAKQAQDAYRHYRRLQHALRLQEGRKVMPDAALLVHYAQVTRLWEQVMQPGPGD